MEELGRSVSVKKLVPPSTKVVCLDILVDTVDLSVSIPAEKLQTIKYMCKNWVHKSFCTKRELQSLLGSLLYVAKCVKYARSTSNRDNTDVGLPKVLASLGLLCLTSTLGQIMFSLAASGGLTIS